jgi:hypothetical protein
MKKISKFTIKTKSDWVEFFNKFNYIIKYYSLLNYIEHSRYNNHRLFGISLIKHLQDA